MSSVSNDPATSPQLTIRRMTRILLTVPDRPGFGWMIDADLFEWIEPIGVWA